MKYCNCLGWKENINKVDSVFEYSEIHGIKYDGKVFDFCPWCGNHLIMQEEIVVDVFLEESNE